MKKRTVNKQKRKFDDEIQADIKKMLRRLKSDGNIIMRKVDYLREMGMNTNSYVCIPIHIGYDLITEVDHNGRMCIIPLPSTEADYENAVEYAAQ